MGVPSLTRGAAAIAQQVGGQFLKSGHLSILTLGLNSTSVGKAEAVRRQRFGLAATQRREFGSTPKPTEVKSKKVNELLVNYLREMGIGYIFGITGKTITSMFDPPQDYDDIRTITTAHEGGASFMAYGYSQATGKIGVVCTTSGGATTNAITGVASAFMNSQPMLVISGQVPLCDFGKNAFQESTGVGRSMDSVAMFKPITKQSTMLVSPQKAGEYFRDAIRLALTGRPGPVHINIPMDVQLAPTEEMVMPKKLFIPETRTLADPRGVERAAKLLAAAKYPVILMGWGAVMSRAHSDLIRLAEKLNIPVATTVQGKGGIPTNHPLCLGVMGLCGHQTARDYIFEQADLLIAVGTQFGEFNTDNWASALKGDKPIIQINVDPAEIARNYPVEVGLVGDAKAVVGQLSDLIESRKIPPKILPIQVSDSRWDLRKYETPEHMEDMSVPIKPLRVTKELRDSTPDDTIFLGDSGSHWGWATHGIPIYKGGEFYPGISLGSMGTAVASSIGIQLAKPNQSVISIVGDGAMLMNGSEISTAAHYNIPVKWVVFNDERYNMPYAGITKLFGEARAQIPCELPRCDFAKMAEAFGVKGYTVTRPGQITEIMPEVLASKKPTVIDVKIDKDPVPPIGQRLVYGQK